MRLKIRLGLGVMLGLALTMALLALFWWPGLRDAIQAGAPLDAVRRALLGAAVGVCLAGGVLAGWLARRLSRALAQLDQRLLHLRQQPDGPAPPMSRRHDEIDRLASHIDALLADRRQREHHLRLAETKFAKAFQSNPDFILISRIRDGRIIDVNRGFERLTGYTAAEAVGRTTLDLGLWADRQERENMLQLLLEHGELHNYEARFIVKDGSIRDVQNSLTLFDLDGEPHLIGNTRDITELKQAREALRHSEERFAKAFQANPSYATVSRLADGCYLAVNQAFEKLTGWRAEEVIGRPVADIGLWAVPAERMELVRRVREHGQWLNFQAHFRKKTGEVILVESSCVSVDIGGEQQLIGVARDITEIQRTEAALRRSEEKFAKVFHASPDAVVITRQDDGVVIDTNAGFEHLTGYELREAFGRSLVSTLGIWQTPGRRREFVDALKAQGRVSGFEHDIRRKNGEIRHCSASAVSIRLDGEPCLITVVRDITEQRRIEAERAKSEEKFAKVFHASPDWIFIVRMADSRILDANEGFVRLSGYSLEEALGQPTTELNLWVDPVRRERFRTELRERGFVHNHRFQMRRKDGEERSMLLSSVVIDLDATPCLISICRDVTDLQRALVELAQSEEKFNKAFRSNPDSIMISRQEDGLIADVNEGFVQVFGYSLDESMGHTTVELNLWLKTEDRQAYVRQLEETGVVRNFETIFLTRAGEPRPVMLSANRIQIDSEPYIIGTARDITEIRRAQNEIRQLNAELEGRVRERTAELEAALGELESFSYSVSHDLRTPLRAIAGYAQVLEEDFSEPLGAAGRAPLERIIANAVRMGELIDDMLDFARVGRVELKRSSFDMSSLVREVRGELAEEQSGRVIDWRVTPLGLVQADRSLIRQVWMNLLSNALKFTRRRETAIIEIGAHAEGDQVCFHVRTTGSASTWSMPTSCSTSSSACIATPPSRAPGSGWR